VQTLHGYEQAGEETDSDGPIDAHFQTEGSGRGRLQPGLVDVGVHKKERSRGDEDEKTNESGDDKQNHAGDSPVGTKPGSHRQSAHPTVPEFFPVAIPDAARSTR
jgi:hypothetical protein